MAELAAKRAVAGKEPPADDEPAADAGAERDQQRALRAPRRPGEDLSQRRAVRVVAQRDRQTEALPQCGADRDALPAEVVRVVHRAGGAVAGAGQPTPTPAQSGRGTPARAAAARTSAAISSSTAAAPRAGRVGAVTSATMRCVSSTTPTAMFVPPRSTPIRYFIKTLPLTESARGTAAAAGARVSRR